MRFLFVGVAAWAGATVQPVQPAFESLQRRRTVAHRSTYEETTSKTEDSACTLAMRWAAQFQTPQLSKGGSGGGQGSSSGCKGARTTRARQRAVTPGQADLGARRDWGGCPNIAPISQERKVHMPVLVQERRWPLGGVHHMRTNAQKIRLSCVPSVYWLQLPPMQTTIAAVFSWGEAQMTSTCLCSGKWRVD